MPDFSALQRCRDLTSAHAKEAAGSRAAIQSLLRRFVDLARPGQGCSRILLALARLPGQPWLEEGLLRVELASDGEATTLNVYNDLGGGYLERLIPSARFRVPLAEFSQALELSPEMVLPLRVIDETDKIVLMPLASPESHRPGPAEFELEDASLGDNVRQTAPPPAPTVPPPMHLSAPPADPRGLPQIYDEILDEGQSTASNEVISQFARLSNMEAMPRLLVRDAATLPLDARTALIVSYIDGRTTLRRILDTCPVSEEEVLRILGQLIRLGIIAVD